MLILKFFLLLCGGSLFLGVKPCPAQVRFVEVSREKPANDPFVATSAFPADGTLLYSTASAYYRRSIVLRTVRKGKVSYLTYLLEWSKKDYFNVVYDVRVASNGWVAFKFGGRDEQTSAYHLWVIEPERKVLTPIEPNARALSSEKYFWSPDGKYLAYLRSGEKVAQLCLYDAAKRSSRVVTSGRQLEDNFSWARPHQLFYVASASGYPSLFRYLPTTRRAQLLFKDGRYPQISPGGKQVAFLATGKSAGTFSLCLSNLDGSGRRRLYDHVGVHARLHWVQNDRVFVCAQIWSLGPDAAMEFRSWDSHTGQPLGAPRLSVSDVWRENVGAESEATGRFQILGSSQDGLIVSASRTMGVQDMVLQLRRGVYSLDPVTGEINELGWFGAEAWAYPSQWMPI
ncbi:hypothetical protein EON80_26350 [bacterium]|nr:MAG: hypothetical protein EON80_26350 [bacterium]